MTTEQCGLGLAQRKNSDGTVTVAPVCKYFPSGGCPNVDVLSTALPTTVREGSLPHQSLRSLWNIAGKRCRGPQQP